MTKSTTRAYLNEVDFFELGNWSVRYLLDSLIEYNDHFELVKLGEVLFRNKTQVIIQDNESYKRVTIKINNGGVFLRDEELGANIGTKMQFSIRAGQFLLSKIDARNGAFGVVPEVVDGAIITGNFWTYDVDHNRVNPEYLALITTTKQFIAFCQRSSAGTTNRLYLQEHLFLNQAIPLPPLSVQVSLVEDYQQKISAASALQAEADALERDSESYLFNALGIQPKQGVTLEKAALNFIDYVKLDQWAVAKDTMALLPTDIFNSSKFPMLPIGDVFLINPTTAVPENIEISFIPMASVSDQFGIILEQAPKQIRTGYTRFKEGDLIWARITPCMENGKSACATGLINGYGFGSTEFHVLRPIGETYSIRLLHALLRTKYLRTIATNFFTGSAGQQRVPRSFLERLRLPVADSITAQEAIVDEVQRMADLKILKYEQARALFSDALKNFENTVF